MGNSIDDQSYVCSLLLHVLVVRVEQLYGYNLCVHIALVVKIVVDQIALALFVADSSVDLSPDGVFVETCYNLLF